MVGDHDVRWVRIGIAFIVLTVIGSVVAFAALLYSFFLPPDDYDAGVCPPDMSKASVRLGAGLLSKNTLLQNAEIGEITDIVVGQLDGEPGDEIGVTGVEFALLLGENGRVKETVKFAEDCSDVGIVDVEGDGVCEFFDQGGPGVAALMDHRGSTLWWYDAAGSLDGVEHSAAGDVNGDGKLEFAVLFGGETGIHLLDSSGKMLWKSHTVHQSVGEIGLIDGGGNGGLDILYGSFGDMVLLDSKGELIRCVESSWPFDYWYFHDFSVSRRPSGSEQLVLVADSRFIRIFDAKGRTLMRLKAAWSHDSGRPRSAVVRLTEDGPEYLALLVEFHRWDRSVLCLYDANWKPVYEEVIADHCEAIAARPATRQRAGSIFLGGEGHVWEYGINSSVLR
jgi:hypothetical protein